jgi:hypothetical protein
MSGITTPVCVFCGIAVLFSAGVAKSQSGPAKVLAGGTKVEIVASYQGADPLRKPDKTVVYDFIVAPDVVTMDDSAAARLHRRRMVRQGSGEDLSPEAVARQVHASSSEMLLNQLRKLPAPVEMALDNISSRHRPPPWRARYGDLGRVASGRVVPHSETGPRRPLRQTRHAFLARNPLPPVKRVEGPVRNRMRSNESVLESQRVGGNQTVLPVQDVK